MRASTSSPSPPESPEEAVGQRIGTALAPPTLPQRRTSEPAITPAVTGTVSISSAPVHFDTSAFVRSSQEEDLEAAIQASLREAYPPPPGPPPLPTRPSVARSGTGALNSSSSTATPAF
ncbi:hypothetical protein FRB94_007865, partial [Tulasnella sp. JGI-2019a]